LTSKFGNFLEKLLLPRRVSFNTPTDDDGELSARAPVARGAVARGPWQENTSQDGRRRRTH
jgi:hypothetical protein